MALQIASLNSGSNGNCYYIGNEQEAVLVDAGISCREIEKRLTRMGLQVKKIKALFISHEHSDHIRGVEVFSRKHGLPVYITPGTHGNSGLKIDAERCLSFRAYAPIQVGGLVVTPFPKLHDAADPHSFIVEGQGITVGVFTDIGLPCKHVITNFSQCHAVFLESNYDHTMLSEGSYPFYLKKRIQSDQGHLSNDQALELYRNHKPAHLSLVLLSHLSRENNSPQLVHKLFEENSLGATIVVASRDYETEVFVISHPETAGQVNAEHPLHSSKAQMSLF